MQPHQQQVITYLHEENRVLKAQLGGRRLRLTDTERRRLAALAYPLGRQRLHEVATIATPDTLLRWQTWPRPTLLVKSKTQEKAALHTTV